MPRSKILFFMSGSIAAFKACQVISTLVKDGHDVQVVATPATFQFVGAATLEGLTGKKVLSDIWERGHAMDHISLTRWADFGVLCPASANTLAKIANGFAEDLVGAMALAWPAGKPFTLIPAMNHQMLKAAATQANLRTLAARGFTVAPTQSGALACGEEGEGRMLEPDQILDLILNRTPERGRVLITGGATREPIDGIRFLSNVSTGQTAATLCDEFSRRGWQVTYLHGVGAQQPVHATRRLGFESFASLDQKAHQELQTQDYAAVIHCAAVSDYSVVNAKPDVKLDSELDLKVELKRNFKILPRLKEYSRAKDIKVIGFKLTLGKNEREREQAGRGYFTSGTVDAVVTNDWSQVEADRSRHPGTLLTADSAQTFDNLATLARELHELIQSSKGASL